MRRRTGLSLRAFAKLVGVSQAAVQKAVRVGRLHKSLAFDEVGPFIADADAALAEWAANRAKPGPKPREARTLAEAQAQVAMERVIALRMANDQKRGVLLPKVEVEKTFNALCSAIRTAILALPTQAPRVARAATLDGEEGVYRALKDVAHECLRELADPARPLPAAPLRRVK